MKDLLDNTSTLTGDQRADKYAERNAALLVKLKAMETERDEAKAKAKGTNGDLVFKVSQKGALSVYRLQRWPVTLYREQWLRLLDRADDIRQFIVDNTDALVTKD